jgi:hypothetical protein
MDLALTALLLMVGFGAIAWAAFRSRELFVLSVRDGRTKLARGRIPPALREALDDVMRRAAVERATLRALRRDGRAHLEATGLSEPVLQRARNVLGTFPAHKLIGASLRKR